MGPGLRLVQGVGVHDVSDPWCSDYVGASPGFEAGGAQQDWTGSRVAGAWTLLLSVLDSGMSLVELRVTAVCVACQAEGSIEAVCMRKLTHWSQSGSLLLQSLRRGIPEGVLNRSHEESDAWVLATCFTCIVRRGMW